MELKYHAYIKKLYCRCFQISFRAALPLMPYREPKLIDGFSGVSKVLRKHNITRLLLVTDPGVYSLGLTTPLEQILKKPGSPVSSTKIRWPILLLPTWKMPKTCI